MNACSSSLAARLRPGACLVAALALAGCATTSPPAFPALVTPGMSRAEALAALDLAGIRCTEPRSITRSCFEQPRSYLCQWSTAEASPAARQAVEWLACPLGGATGLVVLDAADAVVHSQVLRALGG